MKKNIKEERNLIALYFIPNEKNVRKIIKFFHKNKITFVAKVYDANKKNMRLFYAIIITILIILLAVIRAIL